MEIDWDKELREAVQRVEVNSREQVMNEVLQALKNLNEKFLKYLEENKDGPDSRLGDKDRC